MSSHILLATVAAIALSTPAWADDPAEAPVDTEIKAILLDPAKAPIDTEMKIILWLENIEAPLREHIADGGNTVGPGLGARGAGRTGPTIAEYRSAPTNANLAADYDAAPPDRADRHPVVRRAGKPASRAAHRDDPGRRPSASI